MNSNKSILSRAIRILDTISRSGEGISFSQASKVLDSPSPATVNKILKELVEEGVLQKSAEKRYTLGRKVYFWGRVMAAQNTPIQIIRQQMHYLHQQYRVSVNLFTCVDDTMFCLESYLDPQSPLLYPAGKSLPFALSVQGAVFFRTAEEMKEEKYLSEEAYRNEEPVSSTDMENMIDYAHANGIQDDFGLFYPGTRRLAIPLQEQGRTVMTLGVGMSAKRARDNAYFQALAAELLDVRKAIEEVMD